MYNTVVIGYYNHDNIGDEQYKYTIHKLCKNYFQCYSKNITFIDCDKIDNVYIKDANATDIYILGGGDILCDYFLDKLSFFNEPKFKNTKVIALSCGMPYQKYKIAKKMSFVSCFYLRNQSDVNYLSKYYKNVYFMQDSSFLLSTYKSSLKLNIDNKTKESILICPTYLFKEKSKNETLLLEIVKIINNLNEKYNIYLFAFGENDREICNKIIAKTFHNKKNVFLLSNFTNISDIVGLFNCKYFDYVIPMRFHSVLFSTMFKIPFFPIFCTPKIRKYLNDINWNYYYHFDETKSTFIDASIFLTYFDIFTKSSKSRLNEKLQKINADIGYSVLKDVKYNKTSYQFITAQDIYNELLSFGKCDFRIVTDEKIKDDLVKLVSFKITKSTNSKYNWGLKSKMFSLDYDWKSEFDWIIEDYSSTFHYIPSTDLGLYNIDYFNQKDFSMSHRSGWNYVYQHLSQFNNNNSEKVLDLYLDRTFGWDYQINSYLHLIPYTRPWSGFIHHTFNIEFSDYNIHQMFEKPNFIKSLKYCKALFVLSNSLKNQLENYIFINNLKIPVYNFVHPTEMNVPLFNIKKYIENSKINSDKILHIGGWLRNVFSFYNLSGVERKYLIKGINMDNYIPPLNYPNLPTYTSTFQNCCPANQRKWEQDLYKNIEYLVKSVTMIETLTNDEYDAILTENIVFINLYDASAVNTVIECIVRNTPIIINKTNFTIEMLGKNYPLFYTNHKDNWLETNKEIVSLINPLKIKKAHKYLENINKQKFEIKYFLSYFFNIFNSVDFNEKLYF